MIDWRTTALVFPGQGSQHVGMCRELADEYAVVRETFARANEILGYDLADICFNGPKEKLNQTYYTQPAMFVSGIAILRALEAAMGRRVRPALVAGHSLGEFTALAAAGSMTFEEGLRVVQQRAILMSKADAESAGVMAAVLGAELDDLVRICRESQRQTGKTLVVANDNCPGQTVISGAREAFDYAVPLLKEAGIRKVIELPISIAAHSPMMAGVAQDFRAVLRSAEIRSPRVPIVANAFAEPLLRSWTIRRELCTQLSSRVRWTESVRYMRQDNIDTFLEIGPGNVLTNLLKRIDSNAAGIAVNTPEAIASILRGEVAPVEKKRPRFYTVQIRRAGLTAHVLRFKAFVNQSLTGVAKVLDIG